MKGAWSIYKRELFAFFVTPLAWVVNTGFLLLQGVHFYMLVRHFASQTNLSADTGPVQTFFGQTVMMYLPLLVICPILTMRLFAEERRSGTIELLLTAPVSTAAVVLGKYLAVLSAYLVMWAPTFLYMLLAAQYADIDWAVVGSGYLAVIGIGAGYLAVGLMTSALTKSQLSAAILSVMAIIGMFILGIGEFIFPEGVARDLSGYISVWSQLNDFSRGIVDSRRLVFDATLVLLPLFITVRVVESWRTE